MKEEFVRCEFCKIEIPLETCQLAAYRTVIGDKEYVFCCEKCAQRYQKAKKSRS